MSAAGAELGQGGVDAVVADLMAHRDHEWAWANFKSTVSRLIEAARARTVLEIGGGRSPSFSKEDIRALGIDYTSNDISARELGKAPDWVGKAHFDVQTPDTGVIEPFADRFDLAFSKMVMEHVASYERSYRNLHTILREGGVGIAFHPVLYSLPFAINRIMPERASQALLTRFFPNRTDEGTPKFPALYSGCFVSERLRRNLRDIGFRDVWQVPFYGHDYYSKIPLLREAHRLLARQIQRADFAPLASFAYTIVRK